MSTTNDWYMVAGMTNDLLFSIRTYLFSSGEVPTSFTADYGDYTISLTFQRPQTTLTVNPDTENLIDISAPFVGTVSSTAGSDDVSGTVDFSVDVSQLALHCVYWPAWLQMNGTYGEFANCGAIDTFTSDAATLELWMKTESTDAQTLLEVGNDGSAAALPRLSISNNELGIYWGTSSSGDAFYSSDDTDISDGEWHHVAAVFEGSTITYYKDGLPKDSVSMPKTDSGNYLQLGPDFGSTTTFNGEMAQIRLWNVARSTEEIQQTMNSVLDGDESGLIGYWSFTGGDVTNEADGTSGSVTGGAQIVTDEETPSWTIYLNPLDASQIFPSMTVTLDEGSSTDGSEIEGLLSQELAEFANRAELLGTTTISTETYLIPTVGNFITLPDNAELLMLAMTENVTQPSGDANDEFSSDSSIALSGDDNMVLALDDYLILEYVVLPSLVTALNADTSDFKVTQDPAVLSLKSPPITTSFENDDGDGVETTFNELTIQFKDGGISVTIDAAIGFLVISFTQLITVSVDDEGGVQYMVVTTDASDLNLSPNQDNATVIAIEATIAAIEAFLASTGLPGLLFDAIIDGLGYYFWGVVEDKIEDGLDTTKSSEMDSSQFTISQISMDDGIVITGFLTVPQTSTE